MIAWRPIADRANDAVRTDERQIQEALRLFQTQQHSKVATSLTELFSNIRDPRIAAILGVTMYQLGNFEKALEYFKEAVQMDPHDYYSFTNMAICQLHLGNNNQGLEDAKEAASQNPQCFQTVYNLAVAYVSAEMYDKALEQVETCLELNLMSPEAYTLRGKINRRRKDFEKALNDIKKALEISSKHIAALYEKAVLYSMMQKWSLASLQFRKLIELCSENEEAWKKLAQQGLESIKKKLGSELNKRANEEKMEYENSVGIKRLQMDEDISEIISEAEKSPKKRRSFGFPPDMYCPITKEIMTDPVIADDGHSYEKIAIEYWFVMGRFTSPMTNEPLSSIKLIQNHALRKSIECIRISLSSACEF
jgi:tetratricopeptide (TPR) repeat protein